MAGRETALAALLRKAQWMLDDAAFAVGGGRCTPEDRRVLAGALDELAAALRETATEHDSHSRSHTTGLNTAESPADDLHGSRCPGSDSSEEVR
ncbi:hypothetical protein [Haloactinomyces albus]|uniref:Uncharacterized protein n=1 Tax=Haloactinomyces albus TaxID=1352928 RepID=A0AAE4CQ61_9ACTN|nr:hypothetical protein [Haloactinomyces albus]MDR7302338.1 hypothetical protein [Haloactinomyces albus]